MLNIVIPMAGRGSRFQNHGYSLPKPLIEVHNKPMIQLVIDNLRIKGEHRFIFLCLKDHIDEYDIDVKLRQWAPNSEIVIVDRITEGAACTVLLAKDLIDNDRPLMIANSDQWVNADINAYLSKMDEGQCDGFIMTMTANDPKWSYIGLDASGKVSKVVEKQVISDQATVGIYNYRSGSDFVRSAETMIAKNLRVNDEFYVAPAFNEMIDQGKKVGFFNIGDVANGMYGLGTPEDLEHFIQSPVSKEIST